MVLKKIKNMKRHFAELCEGDGNGSKTAPTPVNFAETCTEQMRAPGRPGRKNETPRSGQLQATWPTAGAGKATGAEGDHTAAGRGSAARGSAAKPCWVMTAISLSARASTAELSGSSAGACC